MIDFLKLGRLTHEERGADGKHVSIFDEQDAAGRRADIVSSLRGGEPTIVALLLS